MGTSKKTTIYSSQTFRCSGPPTDALFVHQCGMPMSGFAKTNVSHGIRISQRYITKNGLIFSFDTPLRRKVFSREEARLIKRLLRGGMQLLGHL